MKITVLGDGSFGTALAQSLARNGHEIALWCYNDRVAQAIQETGVNTLFLPGVTLYPTINPTTSLEEALSVKSSFIVEAIPLAYLRSVLRQAKPFAIPSTPWVLGSKGIEETTGFLPTYILHDALEQSVPTIVLSGPSFSQELALNKATALTLASNDLHLAHVFKEALKQENLFIEITDDQDGTQWCGALKNVIALTLGILEGAGYGSNSQALVYTTMIQELQDLILFHKGKAETILSYAGIGDIMLSSYNDTSRNKALGKALGRKEYQGREFPYTEGINTLRALPSVTQHCALPVFEAAHGFVWHQQQISTLITACQKK